MSRKEKATLWVMVGLIVLLCLTDVAFAAKITGITGKADKAVTEGIGTFWQYILYVIPVIGVAAIAFGLWNAITTDRGQSSSVVGGLTATGVGFLMVFIPVMIISGYKTSGSEAASLREVWTARVISPPVDWGSPVTLLIMLGLPIWRVIHLARRRRGDGEVARSHWRMDGPSYPRRPICGLDHHTPQDDSPHHRVGEPSHPRGLAICLVHHAVRWHGRGD